MAAEPTSSELLARTLERAHAERDQALRDAERLQSEALDAETLEESRSLREQAEDARWHARRAETRLPDLEARLRAAQTLELNTRRRACWERRLVVFQRLRTALTEAAAAQAAAIADDQEACRDLGESEARGCLPNITFRGILLSDAVAEWDSWCARALMNPPAAVSIPAPRLTIPAPIADKTLRPPTVSNAHDAVVFERGPRRLVPRSTVDAPRTVSLGLLTESAENKFAKAEPDDLAPLASSQARVKVLRSGFSPADDRPQAQRGQILRMPAHAAQRAAEAGAVEILDDGADPTPGAA